MRNQRIAGMVIATGMSVVGLLFVGWSITVPAHSGLEYMLASLAAGGAVSYAALRGPLGRSLGRMIEGDESEEELLLRVEDLEARLGAVETRALTSGEVDAQYERMAEVEERLDFAERMLTKAEVAPPEVS